MRVSNDPQAYGSQIAVMDPDGTDQRTLETLPAGTVPPVGIETDGPSFSQASTSSDPGPGPFPDILPPEPPPAQGPETYGPGAVGGASVTLSASPQLPHCNRGRPVNCATGNQWEQLTDLAIDGIGGPTILSRTYNSQAAAAGEGGALGPRWTQAFRAHLDRPQDHRATITLDDGSQVLFLEMPDGSWRAADWVQAKLSSLEDGRFRLQFPGRERMTFDASGRLESQADRNGNETTMQYGDDRLSRVIAPSGRSIDYAYNDDGTVAQVTGTAQRTISYEYEDGMLAAVVNVDGGRWEYAYDDRGRMTSMTDPRGHGTMTSYDAHDRVVEQADDAQQTTRWAWSTSGSSTTVDITGPEGGHTVERFHHGLPTSITHAAGTASRTTESLTYDQRGNAIERNDPDGNVWTYAYDDDGNRVAATDPNGRTRTWTFDGDRNMLSARQPSGARTTFEYDAHGNLTSTAVRNAAGTAQAERIEMTYSPRGLLTSRTNALHHTTTYTYDASGDLTAVRTPSGRRTTRTYDENGWVRTRVAPSGNVSGADPLDHTTRYDRNAFGDVTKITDVSGHETELDYDHNRNVVQVTDAAGKQTRTVFDAHDRAVSVHYPDGTNSSTTFDGAGRATATTDRAGKQTTYARDGAGRVAGVTDPLGRTTSYGYDDAGHVTSVTTPDDRTTGYAYDDAGALTDVSYPGHEPADVHLSHDEDGRTAQVVDASGTTTYGYDAFGRTGSVTDGNSATVGYGYDAAGQLSTIDYPVAQGQPAQTLTRTFSQDGELRSVTDWNGRQTTFAYDEDGRYAGADLPGAPGVTDRIERDPAGAITGITVADGADELARFGYTRDALGRVAASTASGIPGDGTRTYARDSADRLTAAGSQTYEYTAAGAITKLDDADSGSYDDAGQLTELEIDGGTTRFGYDAQGARTTSRPLDGPASTYEYDGAGRLAAVAPGRVAPQAAAGSAHTVVVDGGGDGRAWGWGDFGQLGDAPTDDSSVPVQVTGIDRVAQVSAGHSHSLAVDAGGRVLSWGANDRGQLGDPAAPDGRSIPARVAGLASIAQVAGGWQHSLARTSDGAVYAWGGNDDGQLGSGGTARATAPQLVAGLDDVSDVAAGRDSSLALERDGSVWAWGANGEGQLGSTAGSSPHPVRVPGLPTITEVAAGERFAIAVDDEGHVWTWGAGDHGQRGSASPTTAPAMLANVSGIVAVAAGAGHALALDGDGNVYSWGSNQAGELGNGSAGADDATPAPVAGMHDATRIAAGSHTSFAVREDGTMAAWGRNRDGQRGAGNTGSQTTPTTIGGVALALPASTETYTYDHAGLRTRRAQGQSTERFAWDSESAGLPLLLADGDHRYVYGPTGLPVSQIADDGTTLYFHQDQVGSTRALTDAAGDVVGTATYTPYGSLRSHTGTLSKLGFAGGHTDTLTGFQYNRARYYDPATGQFITRDPAEAVTRQPYAYANDDPLSYVDPSGDVGIPSFDQLSNFAAGLFDGALAGLPSGTDGIDPDCSGSAQGAGQFAGATGAGGLGPIGGLTAG
jgi:RHS repeat-associated protein